MSLAPVPGTVTCPHCSADAVAGAEFCSSCGMALPSSAPAGPRVVNARLGPAQTAAGMKLRADELLATAKQAARSLRSIGIVYLAFAGFNAYLMMQHPQLQQAPYFVGVTVSMAVVGAVYFGLFFWANVHPLSATIAGLVVYLLNWGVSLALRALFHPGSTSGSPVSNGYYGYARIFMVIYLVRGIAAAVQHRKLEMQQAAGAAPLPVLAAE